MASKTKSTRLYIGNISSDLAKVPESLENRIKNFGYIEQPLELHTKITNDYYFGYITVTIDDKSLQKLINSLNGVTFMGMKLRVERASKKYNEIIASELAHVENSTEREKINESRRLRIKEAKSHFHTNLFSDNLITSSYLAPSNEAMGYSKSSHTYRNITGKTKSAIPRNTLIGRRSYGAWTIPKAKYFEEYTNISGRGEVIPGRIRKTPRPDNILKSQSLRILINGSLKKIVGHKTKLWGVEKKNLEDLTYVFEKGAWKSASNHIVERLLTSSAHEGPVYEIEKSEEDKSKDKSVLSYILANIDKPIELSDSDDDEKAEYYDHETLGELNDSIVPAVFDAPEKISVPDPKIYEVKYYDEDDEGNEMENDFQYTTESAGKEYDRNHLEQNESNKKIEKNTQSEKLLDRSNDSEEDFIPTFGASETLIEDGTPQSNTEVLRSLFSSSSDFKLSIDADDIDQSKAPEKHLSTAGPDLPIAETTTDNFETSPYGLFWGYIDSPFMFSQSQLSKFGNHKQIRNLPTEENANVSTRAQFLNKDESPYERWFWKSRSELTSECKRRRRDVLRVFKKKTKSKTI